MRTNIFLPEELVKPILDWVMVPANREKCLTVKPPHLAGLVVGRRYLERMDDDLKENKFPITTLNKINTYLLKELGIDKKTIKPETEFGNLISYSEEGHIVHWHKDKNEIEGYKHIRLNVMISRPNEGGDPIINGELYEMQENQLWVCKAGDFYHHTTEVKGKKPRVMISLGHNIPEDYIIKN
jgi:hypothetical protein